MKDRGYQITIRGEEKNKSEIIYNNIIDNMEKENISKEDQIEYLKTKIAHLESNNHSKLILGLVILFGVLSFLFGLFLVFADLDIIGLIFLVIGFVTPVVKLLFVLHKTEEMQNSKYSGIEHLKSMLNSRLK